MPYRSVPFATSLLLCLLLAAPSLGLAQEPSVRGRVVDAYGAAVPDALVTVKRAGRPPVTTTTDAAGAFSVPSLGPGSHAVAVEKPGFRPARASWTASAGADLEVVLEVEGVDESVTVTAATSAGAVESTLKLPSTLHETPRSVTVVGSERIREQDFQYVNDVLNYVPGMAVNSYRTGGYHFYARGYRMGPDDTRVDGFAGLNAGGRYSASLFGVEQAVILRGPAGLLYGSASSPGGFINLVTKKPEETRFTQLDFRTTGYAGNGVGLAERPSAALDVDTTGPLLPNGRILYRALFTVENQNYFTDDVLDRNRYANASLTFKLDEDGDYTLTPMVQWTRFNRPAGGGILISPSTSLSTNDGISSPINTRDLSPLDVNTSEGGGVDEIVQTGLTFNGNLAGAVRVNAAYRYLGYDTEIDQFTPVVATPAQIELLRERGLVERVESRSVTNRIYHNADVNASYEIRSSGWWRSMLQVGGQTRISSVRSATAPGFTPRPHSPIDIYTGEASAPLVSTYPELVNGQWTDTTFWNTFVQNRTALAHGRVVFTVGLGYGQNHVGRASVRKSDLMPNLALLVNVTDQLAVYGSYATSYNPSDPDAEDLLGNTATFDPTIGRNYEIGAKYDLPNRRVSMALAFFHNELDNTLVQSGPLDLNPNGNRYFVQVGARRARGVELTTEVQPIADLRITGSVSYLDAVYTGDGPESAGTSLAIPGSRAEKSPRWSYSVWSRYDRTEGALKGLGGGLGIVWQDERLGSNGARTGLAPDPLLLPAFARVDASLFYRFDAHTDLSLNVENLFDELIFVNGTVGSSLEVAAPRTLSLRLGYRF